MRNKYLCSQICCLHLLICICVILVRVITALEGFTIKWVHLGTKCCVSGIGYKYSLFTGKIETFLFNEKLRFFYIKCI